MKKTRYILTTSFFIYAEDDNRAANIAKDIKKEERQKFDNQYEVECLEENKFGSFKRRKINL